MVEIKRYIHYLSEKAHLDEDGLRNLLNEIIDLSGIRITRTEEFEEHLSEAIRITPDIDDTQYIALALRIGCCLWSNDKKLKEQNQVKVYSTEEITSM